MTFWMTCQFDKMRVLEAEGWTLRLQHPAETAETWASWLMVSWTNQIAYNYHVTSCVCRLAQCYYVVKFYEWSTWYFGGNQMASYHALNGSLGFPKSSTSLPQHLENLNLRKTMLIIQVLTQRQFFNDRCHHRVCKRSVDGWCAS